MHSNKSLKTRYYLLVNHFSKCKLWQLWFICICTSSEYDDCSWCLAGQFRRQAPTNNVPRISMYQTHYSAVCHLLVIEDEEEAVVSNHDFLLLAFVSTVVGEGERWRWWDDYEWMCVHHCSCISCNVSFRGGQMLDFTSLLSSDPMSW